jgi:hypothetical protein
MSKLLELKLWIESNAGLINLADAYDKLNELLIEEQKELEVSKEFISDFYCHDECIDKATEDFPLKKCNFQCENCRN